MREPREPRTIIAAAEQAAAAGDYTSAEALLREAALVQETSVGSLHPDLANTLNNLGVVCELTGNAVDAEHCFRRACTIAEAVLEPDHPFVVTSRKNLRDFCEARGKPVEMPPLPPAVTTTPETRTTASADPPRASRILVESQDAQPPGPRRSIRSLAIGAFGPGAMLILILAATCSWRGSMDRVESSSAAVATDSREAPVPAQASSSVEPIPVEEETTTATAREPAAASASVIAAAPAPARPTVVRAQLCAELYEWQCDPADDPVSAGLLFFYTQVKSPSATTIHHHWYRDDHLHQSVELRIQASPHVGYRTYSRSTVNSDSAGSWRVELRSEDGIVLHEERFSVR